MDKSIPNLQDLIYFVITGRSSSIPAASIESGIPVATLSRRISALEKRVNIQLFTRTSRGIVLTEIGRHYLKYADAIIKNATDLEREMKDSHNSLSGVLR
ncbi:LysR family transcriptional regulator, partial [Escherichia coli]|uniref:LysR family transcriptional regulator n=1 Tax=Escherichia coli TaxID=562 RepID=UPI0013278894